MKKSRISPEYENYVLNSKNNILLQKFVEKHRSAIVLASIFAIFLSPCLYFIPPEPETDDDY